MSRENKQPYVRFFASDWLGGTRGMSASEMGIYITLIAMMYERCEPLPEDHKRLARQCGTSAKTFKDTLEMLIEDGKVIRIDGGLWNKRVQEEFNWREEKSTQAKDAVAAREKKKKQNQRTPETDDDQTIIGNASKPEARSHIEKREPNGSPKKTGDLFPPGFDPKLGVKPDVAEQYVKHRKVKKAPLTDGAYAGLNRELLKLHDRGFDANVVLEDAMAGGWQGIKADWILKSQTGTGPPGRPPPQQTGTAEGFLADLHRRRAAQ